MIYQKTKLNIAKELGTKHFLLQTKEEIQAVATGNKPKLDGKVGEASHVIGGIEDPGSEHDVERETLIKAASVYGNNRNFSKEEIAKIEAIDKVFEKVDVVVDAEKGAIVVHEKDNPHVDEAYRMGIFRPENIVDKAQEFFGMKESGRKDGTGDQEILKAGYLHSVEDGQLTKKEIEKLKGVDDALPNADMSINLQTGDATIIYVDEGRSAELNIKFPQTSAVNPNAGDKGKGR